MTGRVLRIELRRSALWATAVAVLVALNPQVSEGMTVLAGIQRAESLAFVAPLALGVGAWQARRDRRSRTTELFTTTPRPPWQRLLARAAAIAIGALAGFAVVTAGITVYALVVGAYVPALSIAAMAVTAVYVATALWLGLAVGRLLPYVMVPPLLVIFGLVFMAFLALSADLEGYVDGPPPASALLNPVQAEGFDYFETLTGRAHLAQAVWGIALAVACLVLCVAARYRRLAAAVPVVLGAVLAGALLPGDLRAAVTLDRGAVALVCTSDDPQVCVRRAHPFLLDDLREPGRQALAILSARLPQAPSTVVEYYTQDFSVYANATPPAPDRDILYAVLHSGGAGGSEREILWTLLMGAGTLECDLLDPGRYEGNNAARLVAAAWLLEEEPAAVAGDDWRWVADLPATGTAYEALLALPAGEQRARVAALREAELACDGGNRLALLVD
jgi:hypothetical protein